MFRTMPVVPGAAEALWRLSDAGVWIRLITHRLYANWNHAVAVGDTVAWLDDHSIPYRDLCFLGDKPQVEADAYVDDAPAQRVSLRGTGCAGAGVQPALQRRDRRAPRPQDGPRSRNGCSQRMASGGRPVQAPMPLPGDVGSNASATARLARTDDSVPSQARSAA